MFTFESIMYPRALMRGIPFNYFDSTYWDWIYLESLLKIDIYHFLWGRKTEQGETKPNKIV